MPSPTLPPPPPQLIRVCAAVVAALMKELLAVIGTKAAVWGILALVVGVFEWRVDPKTSMEEGLSRDGEGWVGGEPAAEN
ncbi:hypothetical protein PIB30_009410 [Stylosanthes scabra]|uniref:Uncharacterized protein n=1 Tax=Stylosanthes scabra TaxID=79078 RepID=A0ABU6W545_9FABA|nr:hypothetical protein [Stylosanthes scabra]